MAAITKKPKGGVTSLAAPVRQSNSRTMKATWKVPSSLIKSTSKSRATRIEVDWTIDIPGNKDRKKVTKTGNEKLNNSSINLNSLKIGNTTYSRSSFYPINSNRLLYGVSVKVIPYNKKGKGKAATATRKFAKPRAPEIDDITFDGSNGEISTTIKTDAGEDYRERYDTRYQLYIKDTHSGYEGNFLDTNSTDTEIPVKYDAPNYQALNYDEYIHAKLSAWARGYAGDSEPLTEKEYYISYPARPSITDVKVSEKDSTGKVTVHIDTNSSDEHPVDQVKLVFLSNVDYETAEEIPAETGTESDITDDGECQALTIPVSTVIPDRGKYTWIRVKSWHGAENILCRYSEWVRLYELETPAPTAVGDDIVILSAAAGSDGESAIVHLGWNVDGEDDSTSTELSWSDAEDCWRSTEEPSSYSFKWSDGEVTHEGVTYHDSATITIKGLEEATKYYIKARRCLEADETTYSEYSNTATILTSEKPETVVASCDRYIPTGKSLPVYWTFSGNGIQTEWQIIKRVLKEVEGQMVYVDDAVIANGQGSYGSTQISADRLQAIADDNTLTFVVQASTGSGFVSSEENTVTIIDAPTMELTVPQALTIQPLSFDVTVSSLCDFIVIVTSQGATGDRPEGFRRQTSGDTIHSGIYSPVWEDEASPLTATITIPEGMDFWDLGTYTVSVTAVDRMTSLRSEEQTASFEVGWRNQAVDPYDAITLTPIDEYDEEGFHRMAVQIDLTPPDGAGETDVYDIYRKTGDGPVLIGEGFPLTYTAVDEYAPFSTDVELEYRIALRTADGDVEFADIGYEMPGDTLRFDWETGFLELPYNLSIGDTYKKDVEIRQHMDGSVDGYWNPNITRTGKLNTDVVKLHQKEEVEAARQLARYSGPVFIRTPEGSAYEADVQVSDMSSSNKTMMAIAIDATETGLTQEFILPIPYILEDEGE